MSYEVAVIIPARWGSSRFPGKPLALVAGRTILERTVRNALAVQNAGQVYVATDDERIAEAATRYGAQPIMTRGDYATGTDRVAAAASLLENAPFAVLNLQGDALLTPPWVLQTVVDALMLGTPLVTPAVRLDRTRYAEFMQQKQKSPTSGTTVTVDRTMHALYFSKAVLPFVRNASNELPPVYRHIGVYGYRADVLAMLARLPPSPLEQAEGLEQLRALENNISIRVLEVDYRGRTHGSIDTLEDIAFAETVIAREGELVR